MFVLEVIPQRRYKLRGSHCAGVVSQQTQYENAVLAEVLPHELARSPLAFVVSIESLFERQMSLDVVPLPGKVREPPDPHEQRQCRHDEDEHQPEPDDQEDLLVEQVDRQHALDVVVVDGAQSAHLEVAHRHSRKPHRRLLRPVVTLPRVREHVTYHLVTHTHTHTHHITSHYAAITTTNTIRLRFDGHSTAYQRFKDY